MTTRATGATDKAFIVSNPCWGWRWRIICRDVYITCPNQDIYLTIYTNGALWINVNGNWVYNYPQYPSGGRSYIIPAKLLKCGCNKICIYVRTYNICPSVRYQYHIPPCNPNCPWPGAYNKRECRCECLRGCCPKTQYVPFLPDKKTGCACKDY